MRHIYLRAYRYNLHLMPKSLLIEAGAQTNTVEEMMNAMEVLSECWTMCLSGDDSCGLYIVTASAAVFRA